MPNSPTDEELASWTTGELGQRKDELSHDVYRHGLTGGAVLLLVLVFGIIFYDAVTHPSGSALAAILWILMSIMVYFSCLMFRASRDARREAVRIGVVQMCRLLDEEDD